MDYDASRMLEPFIRHDLVTVVPWLQDGKDTMLGNDQKNGNSRECLSRFANLTDWVSVMDTDETYYFKKKDGQDIGVLSEMLR